MQQVQITRNKRSHQRGICVCVRRQVEHLRDLCPIQHRRKPGPMVHNLCCQLLKILIRQVGGNHGDLSGLCPISHGFYNIGAQQGGGAVFHFLELWADAGLHWKAAQKRGAERMDCLNFQPAGCFQRAGK